MQIHLDGPFGEIDYYGRKYQVSLGPVSTYQRESYPPLLGFVVELHVVPEPTEPTWEDSYEAI